jgi:hypothetical protein
MTVLLIVTSAMLAVLGAVKLLNYIARRMRSCAFGAVGDRGSGSPDDICFAGDRQVRWLVPTAVVLLLTSSFQHGLRLGAHRRRRSDTEGGRLASYIRYSAARGDRGSSEPV